MKTIVKTGSILLLLAFSGLSCFGQRIGYGFFTPNAEFALNGTAENATPVLQAGMDLGVGMYVNEHLGIYAGFGGYRSIISFGNIVQDSKNSINHNETACGPKVFVGLDWFILPYNAICPKASVYVGYRHLVSSFHDDPLYDVEGFKKGNYGIFENNEEFEKTHIDIRYVPIMDYTWNGKNYKSVQHGADGFFFGVKTGADFKINEFAINVSLYYELAQYHDGAIIGDNQERFGYFDYVNGVPSYRPWTYLNYKNKVNTEGLRESAFFQKFRSVFGISISFVI